MAQNQRANEPKNDTKKEQGQELVRIINKECEARSNDREKYIQIIIIVNGDFFQIYTRFSTAYNSF